MVVEVSDQDLAPRGCLLASGGGEGAAGDEGYDEGSDSEGGGEHERREKSGS